MWSIIQSCYNSKHANWTDKYGLQWWTKHIVWPHLATNTEDNAANCKVILSKIFTGK
jgi:hypothetical protein